MATLAEIAAIKRRMGIETANTDPTQFSSFSAQDQGPVSEYISPGLVIQPDPITPVPGAPPTSQPGPLATDADVNAAYQALMQYMAQGDQDKGTYQRQLQTNLDLARNNRAKTIMGGHQNAADRGILNSGIALTKDAEYNTQYDALERGYSDNYTDAVNTIDRNITGLQKNYDNSTIAASAKYTKEQTDAAAALIASQQAQALQQQQMADLMAMLAPAPPTEMTAPPNPIVYAQSIPAYHPPAPKKNPISPAGAGANQIKQVIRGGPQ